MSGDLESALSDLASPLEARRLSASRVLARAACRVSSRQGQETLGRRSVTAKLVRALADTNPKVVQNAVIALAEICRRYFKDDRAYPALVRQLTNSDALTRLWAVEAAVILREVRSLPDVLPLARDRSAKVRAEVLRYVLDLFDHPEQLAAVAEELRAVAEAAAEDADRQVREYGGVLANVLGISVVRVKSRRGQASE